MLCNFYSDLLLIRCGVLIRRVLMFKMIFGSLVFVVWFMVVFVGGSYGNYVIY